MNERQKRLIEVYDHLRKYCGIHTKSGFAEAIHYGRTSMSAAMNGDESYLTDNLFKTICAAFPQTFSLEYLLTGEGSLLLTQEQPQQTIDQSSLVNALLASKDETIKSKEETIASLNETIESLKRENADLRQQVDRLQQDDLLHDYPFAHGVAESITKEKDIART